MIEQADQRVDELLASLDSFCEPFLEDFGLPIDAAGHDLREIVYRWLHANGVAFMLTIPPETPGEGANGGLPKMLE